MGKEIGYCEGEECNRDGCKGIIAESREGSCTCFQNPPCSYCTDDGQYCPECEWSNADDNREARRKEIERENLNPTPKFVFDAKAHMEKMKGLNKGKKYEVIKYFDTYPVGMVGDNLDYEEACKVLDQYRNYSATYVTYEMRELIKNE